jgi:hypothetical protein
VSSSFGAILVVFRYGFLLCVRYSLCVLLYWVVLTVRVKLMTLTSFTKPSKRGGKYSRGILFQKGVGYVRISFMKRGKNIKGIYAQATVYTVKGMHASYIVYYPTFHKSYKNTAFASYLMDTFSHLYVLVECSLSLLSCLYISYDSVRMSVSPASRYLYVSRAFDRFSTCLYTYLRVTVSVQSNCSCGAPPILLLSLCFT